MKKIIGMLLISVLSFSFMMTVAAETIQPRYRPCEQCDNGKLSIITRYGAWKTTEISSYCSHGFPKGYDETQERVVYTAFKCDTCTFKSDDEYDHTEEREICYGKDRSAPVEE